jgi:hypothetical protein
VKAFAECAEEEMSSYENIWHAATGYPNLSEFRSADPDFSAPFEGLDRSRIPATGDCLISEGQGLYTFLYTAKSLHEERTPMQTVGETNGPAYMSHGRALHMFGEPEDPGDDPKPAATKETSDVPSGEASNQASGNVQQSVDDLTAPLLEALRKTSIARDKPTTEKEFREKNAEKYNPTKSIVPGGKDPWTAVLGFDRFALWTPMLCNQYAELVRAKKEQTTVHGYNGWPDVEDLTFEGFTNWVVRCKQVDPLFGRAGGTVKTWAANMRDRSLKIAQNLAALKVVETYNDAKHGAKHSLPLQSQYYNGQPLLVRDMKKLGWTAPKQKQK